MLRILMIATMIFLASPVLANQLWSSKQGRWELFAWDGRFKYCAMKTYMPNGQEISIRKNTVDGTHMIFLDNRIISPQTLEIYFDGQLWGVFDAKGGVVSNRQIATFFDDAGSSFMDAFTSSRSMGIKGQTFSLLLGLDGTRILGEELNRCARHYRF